MFWKKNKQVLLPKPEEGVRKSRTLELPVEEESENEGYVRVIQEIRYHSSAKVISIAPPSKGKAGKQDA